MDFLQKHNKGIKVKPRSGESIRGLAQAFRRQIGKVEPDECLDIVQILESTLPAISRHGFEFLILDKETMGDTEAAMSPDTMNMCIREDVYEALHRGDLRARFTIAHEFGHFVLHEGIALARGSSAEHKTYEDSEWQANCFAAELLAPLSQCKNMSQNEIATKFKVSNQCAAFRLKAINKK